MDAAPQSSPSITNWIPCGFFLLGVSTSHYFFLLNSTRFSRVSWFHTQTFCFQETAMILSAMRPVPSPTPPNKAPEESNGKYCAECGHFVTIHGNGNWNLLFCCSANPSRWIDVGESSETDIPTKLSRGWKTDIVAPGLKDLSLSKRRLSREVTTA